MPSGRTATQTGKTNDARTKNTCKLRPYIHRRLTGETKVSWRKTGDQSQTKETKLNTRQETGKLKQEVTKHQTQRQRLDKTHRKPSEISRTT